MNRCVLLLCILPVLLVSCVTDSAERQKDDCLGRPHQEFKSELKQKKSMSKYANGC